VKLKRGTPVQTLSATLPPHIRQCVLDNMYRGDSSTVIDISRTLNRRNTMYCMRQLDGALTDFSNLDFLIPQNATEDDVKSMKQVLIFYDDVSNAQPLADYLNKRFPSSVHGERPVRHYHSLMSKDYLLRTFDGFATGEFKILIATDGASTVITYYLVILMFVSDILPGH
jgi:superfamily II DNA/RNA helicase